MTAQIFVKTHACQYSTNQQDQAVTRFATVPLTLSSNLFSNNLTTIGHFDHGASATLPGAQIKVQEYGGIYKLTKPAGNVRKNAAQKRLNAHSILLPASRGEERWLGRSARQP